MLQLEKEREEEEERERKERDNRKAKSGPSLQNVAAPVRLTLAAVLREDALYKKKQEEEQRIIQAYER